MKANPLLHFRIILLLTITVIMTTFQKAKGQQTDHRIIRVAKIQVDAAQLKNYSAALKLSIETSVRLEPGVLAYYAFADKADAAHITILEIYADEAAYQSHIQTAHFKKYKETVKNMVKSLELTDVDMITTAKKPGI